MPFEKGQSGNPNGRPVGAKNKSSKQVRQAISFFIDDNIDNLQGWINQIAKDDPRSAFQCVIQLLEFGLPKLRRETIIEEKEKPTKCNTEAHLMRALQEVQDMEC